MIHRPQTSTLFPYTTLFRSGDVDRPAAGAANPHAPRHVVGIHAHRQDVAATGAEPVIGSVTPEHRPDRKSTRLNSSHRCISYAVFCLKKKKKKINNTT